MTVGEALKKAIDVLKIKSIETPVLDAEVILCSIIEKDKAFLYAHSEYVLSDGQTAMFFELTGKRAAGMPLQYITGHQEFMSLDFLVTPDVLIPRHDTEILVETVINHASRLRETQDSTHAAGFLEILDMGTGSGCIAVSLAHYIPECRVTAVDISEKALEIARINAINNGVQHKILFQKSDLFSGLINAHPSCRFDIIVSNPPYIPESELESLEPEVRDYEPLSALNGGGDGLDFFRAIIDKSPAFLKAGGLLAMEVGYNQAETVCKIMEQHFANIYIIKDLGGVKRVVAGT